jgi:hypothetical protein
MSGKRARPSPWRFLRLVPVALVSMAVCAMVGLFLLLSDPGDDQAHDWGVDPVPSGSQEPRASGPDSSPADSPEPSSLGTATPAGQATTVQPRNASAQGDPSPETPTARVQLKRAAASVPASRPLPRPTNAPTPEPTVPVAAPAEDNPGKKKGHRKGHGPQGHPNR